MRAEVQSVPRHMQAVRSRRRSPGPGKRAVVDTHAQIGQVLRLGAFAQIVEQPGREKGGRQRRGQRDQQIASDSPDGSIGSGVCPSHDLDRRVFFKITHLDLSEPFLIVGKEFSRRASPSSKAENSLKRWVKVWTLRCCSVQISLQLGDCFPRRFQLLSRIIAGRDPSQLNGTRQFACSMDWSSAGKSLSDGSRSMYCWV